MVNLSPRGRPLDQGVVRDLAAEPGLTLLCGRYEGIDERVLEARGVQELSVGDFVLSGGEVAALTVLDAVVRLLPGVMGNAESGGEESFERRPGCLLEYPHYTRPADWQGRAVPAVLQSGDHARIARWRRDDGGSGSPGPGARTSSRATKRSRRLRPGPRAASKRAARCDETD